MRVICSIRVTSVCYLPVLPPVCVRVTYPIYVLAARTFMVMSRRGVYNVSRDIDSIKWGSACMCVLATATVTQLVV